MKKSTKLVNTVTADVIPEIAVPNEVDDTPIQEEGVSPVFAAKQAGKHGPQCYQMIKSGKLRSWTNSDGKVRVNLDEALRVLATIGTHNMSKSANTDSSTKKPLKAAFKITKEAVIAWRSKSKQKAAVITATDPDLTTFTDQDGKVYNWSTRGLEKNIQRGVVSIADAASIIQMLKPIVYGTDYNHS